MERLSKRGLNRTSGHNIKESFGDTGAGGSIPPNIVEDDIPEDMIKCGNNAANDTYTKLCKQAGIKIHPARFPAALPEFFLKLLTGDGDYVLDPFAGSNTTGAVAESLGLRWIAVEMNESYLHASRFRFFV
jgi:site-specific DNA-methyltransferase (cytosine-N4-specific)